ncbi:esterase/lipase family protein, partial [Candidatus Margulisiibacteriota bacterium]
MKTTTFIIICLLFILFFTTTSSNAINDDRTTASSPNYLIILVHGIISNKEAFEGPTGLKSFLENELGLKGYVYPYSFEDNRGSIAVSADELGNPTNEHYWIGNAKEDFKKWYAKEHLGDASKVDEVPNAAIPEKVILICHSMGGVAAREYITSAYYQNDVKRIITLDTPHLGSDLVTYLKKFAGTDSLLKNAFTQGADDYLKKEIVDKLKKRLAGMAENKLKDGLMSKLGFLFKIKTLDDIYKDSAHWVVEAESPKIEKGILKYTKGQSITPTLTAMFLKYIELLIFSGEGLNQLDPKSTFINDLKNANIKSGSDPISFRLVSAKGVPTPNKELIDKYYWTTPYMVEQIMPYMAEYKNLPMRSQRYWALLSSMLLSGSMTFKDGSIVVAVDSSRGEGVSLFNNSDTKRYDITFRSDVFEDTMDAVESTYYACLAAYTASSMFGVGSATEEIFLIPMFQLTYFSLASIGVDLVSGINDSALKAHIVMPTAVTLRKDGKSSIIEQALDDIPDLGGTITSSSTTSATSKTTLSKQGITSQSLSTPTASFNDYDQPFVLLSNLDPKGNQTSDYHTVSIEAYTEGAPDPTTSWPLEIDGKKKWVTSVTVKEPPTAIKAVIDTFLPLKLKEFKYSDNFAAWENIPKVDRWGNFVIKDLKLAEGQNMIAFKATSFAD